MSAHALITASADPFFKVTKAVRAELAQLEKLAASIAIGGDGKAAAQTKVITAAQRELNKALQDVKDEYRAQTQAELDAKKASREASDMQRKAALQAREAAKKKREDTKDATKALREQKQEGAAMSREIDAGFRRNGVSMNRFGDITKTVTGYLKDIPRDIRVKMRVSGMEDIKAVEAEMKRASRAELGSRVGSGLSTASTAAGAGIIASLGMSVKAAVQWEDAFTGVAKTVDATKTQLTDLRTALLKMSTEIPVSAEALAKIAENAGQLGIQTSSIKNFTRVMADLSATTNLTADQASTDLAKIANITKMPQAQFDRLGSTLVDLGNKGASTEADIVAMALRIAGAGKQVGLSNANILAFASALSSVGIEAEAGGSAISKVFVGIDKSVRNGGSSLETFARVSGMSAAQFQKAFKTDADGAITSFVAGLGKIQKSGGDVFGTLEKLGFSEIRVRDALLRMGGNAQLLSKSLNDADKAWQANNALTKEAATRYGTSASQIAITKNQLTALAIVSGEVFLPVLNKTLVQLTGLFGWLKSLPPETQENIVKTTAFAGVLLLLAGRLKAAIEVAVLLKKAMDSAAIANVLFGRSVVASTGKVGAFQVATALATRGLGVMRVAGVTAVGGIGGAFARLGAVGGPLALVAIAIAGFATAFYGARDAGSMSADKLREKWGLLGATWDTLGNKIANLWTKINGTQAAGDAASRKSYDIASARAKKRGQSFMSYEEYNNDRPDDAGGVNSTSSTRSGNVAAKIAREAERMQAFVANFNDQCDRLADVTVRATTSIYSNIMGPRKGDTAAKTMARFQRAKIGFKPDKKTKYNPGDLVYTGDSVGDGAGHVMTVGPDGRFLDQHSVKRGKAAQRPITRPEWVVRPPGSRATNSKRNDAMSWPLATQKPRTVPRGSVVSSAELMAGRNNAIANRNKVSSRVSSTMWVDEKGQERFNENKQNTAGLDARLQLLKDQAEAVADLTKKEYSRADAEERLAFIQEETAKLVNLEYSPKAAATMAEQRAQALDIIKAQERRNVIGREWAALQDETSRVVALAAKEEQAYLSLASGPERERALAMAREESRLRGEASTEGYTEGDVQSRLGVFGKNYDIGFRDSALQVLSQASDQANQSIATFGDTTGLAAAKWEMARGSLAVLTEAEKEAHLVTLASIQGIQAYASAYDSLLSQKYSLKADNAARSTSLTGGDRSELGKQELAWKMEDAEMSERLIRLTDAQRVAYDEMRPSVLAARQEVRGLLQESAKLAAPEWFKDFSLRAKISMEPDDIKRARMELEQQLIDAGMDKFYITPILNANELQLRFEQTKSNIQDFMGQINGVMGQGLDALYTNGFGGFFNSVAQGFSEMINNISKQLISGALTKLFIKLPQGNPAACRRGRN
jgi:TP901 family phage tail tape measure protein